MDPTRTGSAQTDSATSQAEYNRRFAEIAAHNLDVSQLTDRAIEAAAEHDPAQVELVDALGQVSLGSSSVQSGETARPITKELPNVEQTEALSALDLKVIMGISAYFVLGVRRRAQITREDARQ